MKIFLLAFIGLLLTFKSYSTCIIIVKTKDTIYVAADSKRGIRLLINGTITEKFSSVCKIENQRNVYYAIAGHDDAFLHLQAAQSLAKYKTVDSSVSSFAESVKQRYYKVMLFAKIKDTATYNYYLKNDMAAVSFFGFEKGKSFLITVEFFMKDKGNIEIAYKITKDFSAAQLGIHDHLDKLSNKDFTALVDKRGVIYSLENSIELEIKYHPHDIGYPIDLLKLTSAKPIWVRKKKVCTPYESPMTL